MSLASTLAAKVRMLQCAAASGSALPANRLDNFPVYYFFPTAIMFLVNMFEINLPFSLK